MKKALLIVSVLIVLSLLAGCEVVGEVGTDLTDNTEGVVSSGANLVDVAVVQPAEEVYAVSVEFVGGLAHAIFSDGKAYVCKQFVGEDACRWIEEQVK